MRNAQAVRLSANNGNAVLTARTPVHHSTTQAPFLYVIETDFVFVKPIVAPLAESSAKSIAFSCA